jgi:hypothetical protein
MTLATLACGGKQPEETSPQTDTDNETTKQDTGTQTDEQAPEVVSAQAQIKDWLGKDLTQKVSSLGKDLGKDVGLSLAKNDKILGRIKDLSKGLLKDPKVKPLLKKIEDKATAGLGNKLTLGWKALKAGGIDEYKKKVMANAERVAVDVLTEYLRDHALKDARMGELLKDFAPILKMQGKVSAIALQENISPRVTKKVLGIALRIAATGSNAEMANRVESWITNCDDDTEAEVEKLISRVAKLDSVHKAVAGLALEVLKHKHTKKELTDMTVSLVRNSSVNKNLVKVYEAAAFDKGDSAIRASLVKTVELEIVDDELFGMLNRLASAQGAGPIIGKYASKVTADPKLAQLVEEFIYNLLEICGDPTKSAE